MERQNGTAADLHKQAWWRNAPGYLVRYLAFAGRSRASPNRRLIADNVRCAATVNSLWCVSTARRLLHMRWAVAIRVGDAEQLLGGVQGRPPPLVTEHGVMPRPYSVEWANYRCCRTGTGSSRLLGRSALRYRSHILPPSLGSPRGTARLFVCCRWNSEQASL